MIRPLFAIFLSTLLFAACDSADSGVSGALRYQIDLVVGDPSVGAGEFEFDEPIVGSSIIGGFILNAGDGVPVDPLTVVSGSLTVFLNTDGMIEITILDPDVSDTGLRFEGDFSPSGFSGAWGDITLAGYTERGTFTATLKE